MLSRRLRATMGRLLRRYSILKPLVPIYEKLSTAVGAYRHRGDALALAFGVALMTWVFSNTAQWFLAESLPGAAGIPLLYIFLMNPLIGLVLLVPISIGGLGVNQNAFEFFYGLVGISATVAVSVSSAAALQSLSRPSQISSVGSKSAVQVSEPPVQVV